MRTLGEHRWPDLDGRPNVLAVPLGSCEQHGPHLPLDTDTRIAIEMCRRLASAEHDVVVTPAIAITASGEHAGFPGTLSVGTEVLARVLVEVVRSADWATGVVLVNGHGGNVQAIRTARSTLAAEGRSVLSWWPHLGPDADAHAGRTETSLMLALDPHCVAPERAPGRIEPLRDLLAVLQRDGVAAVSPSGVLGDPTTATAEEGRQLLAAMEADLVAAYTRWRQSAGHEG